QPPYQFSFAPRGNRSFGFVETTGRYLPGPNVGAIDLLEVIDSTGSTAQVTPAPVVYGQLLLPGLNGFFFSADVDGDGRDDLVISRDTGLPYVEVTVIRQLGGGILD